MMAFVRGVIAALNSRRVDVEAIGLDIDEHRMRAEAADRADRGEE